MSLQVWLPLNGDFNNQGIHSAVGSGLGTVAYNTAGKIGSAFIAGGTTQVTNGISLNSNFLDILQSKKTASVAVWVKPLGNHFHYNGTIFSSGNWNAKCWAFGVSQDNTKVDVFCSKYNNYVTCAVPVNTWTHLVSIYNNRTCTLYKNGEYVATYTASQDFDSDATNSCVGRETYASGYFGFNGLINDFRLYDHCLSVREVKELARGLRVHYKLDNNGFGQENLAKDASGIWVSGLGSAAGSRAEYRYRTLGQPLPVTSGTKVRVSFDVHMEVNTARSASARKLLVYNTNNKGPHYGWVSYECWSGRAVAAGEIIDDHISFTTTVNDKSDATATNDFIEFYSEYGTSNWYSISNFHVEVGEKETPWAPNSQDALYSAMGLGTTIADCSGYINNGTILNSISYVSATPRYSTSVLFNGTNAKIKLPALDFSGMTNTYTFSWWQYNISTGNMPWGFSNGNRLNVYHTNPLCWNTGDGSSNQFKDGSTTIAPGTLTNAWHHMAVTGDGTSTKLYIDGVYRGTATTYKPLTGTQIYISGWDTGTSYTFNGSKISDFRIYSTTLSQEDIRELYATSAEIDRRGAFYTRELIE